MTSSETRNQLPARSNTIAMCSKSMSYLPQLGRTASEVAIVHKAPLKECVLTHSFEEP